MKHHASRQKEQRGAGWGTGEGVGSKANQIMRFICRTKYNEIMKITLRKKGFSVYVYLCIEHAMYTV